MQISTQLNVCIANHPLMHLVRLHNLVRRLVNLLHSPINQANHGFT